MTQTPNKLSARRVTLMASVAGLGLAVLLTGPSAIRAINGPAWTGTAVAAENMLAPTGFADIVAKVKPAVISVRIRMDSEKTASVEDNDDTRRSPAHRSTASSGSSGSSVFRTACRTARRGA